MEDFCLVVTAQNNTWKKNPIDSAFDEVEPYILGRERMLEYTSDDLKEKYQGKWDKLKGKPCILVHEINTEGKTYLGLIRRITDRATNGVRITYSTILKLDIANSNAFWSNESLMHRLDISGAEQSRTHLAVKQENFLKILGEEKVISDKDFIKAQNIFGNHGIPNNPIRKILADPIHAKNMALSGSYAVQAIIEVYCNSTHKNDLPDEWEFLEEIAKILDSIEQQLDKTSQTKPDKKIAQLEQEIKNLQEKVSILEKKLAESNKDSPWQIYKENAANSLGKHTGSLALIASCATLSYLTGLDLPEIVKIIKNLK